MSFTQICRSSFGAGDVARGTQYYREGRAQTQATHGAQAKIRVRGGGGRYDVMVDWSAADKGCIKVSCDCPRYEDGVFCKHIWASLLLLDGQNVHPGLPRGKRLSHCEVEPLEQMDIRIEFFREGSAASKPTVSAVSQPPRAPAFVQPALPLSPQPESTALTVPTSLATQSSWKKELTLLSPPTAPSRPTIVPTLDVGFVLDVSETLRNNDPQIAVVLRSLVATGEAKPWQLVPTSQYASTALRCPTRVGRALKELGELEVEEERDPWSGFSRYYSSRRQPAQTFWFRMKNAWYLLPQLCATGKFFWTLSAQNPQSDWQPLAWSSLEYSLRLRAEECEAASEWQLQGALVRDGEPPVPLVAAVMVTSNLVLHDNQLSPFRDEGHQSWVSLLQRKPILRIPYAEKQEFQEFLLRSADLPPRDFPPSLQWEEVIGTLQKRIDLRLSGGGCGGPSIAGQVNFAYRWPTVEATAADAEANTVVVRMTVTNPVVSVAAGRLIQRDQAAERVAISQIHSRGLGQSADPEWDLSFSLKDFTQQVNSLIDAGWEVRSQGKPLKKSGGCHMSVVSSIDWFDLDGEFDFDGCKVKLPRLLAAVRSGEQVVRLDDGSCGLLPQEWLRKYAGWIDLGETTDDGAVRFRPSQALILDALLAAQPTVQIDKRFAEFREKLQSFSGISARKAPDSFTGKLRKYQETGLGWFAFLNEFGFGGCLADDMGLGKTVQVLAWLDHLRQNKPRLKKNRRPTLVVVPKSLVFNWMDEAAKFTTNLKVLNYTGVERQLTNADLGEYDLIVTTYGTVRMDIEKLREITFGYVILDEAQAIKNSATITTKACRLLKADRRLAMSGTPVENHLGELWSLFEFLNPGLLGGATAFQKLTKTAANDPAGLKLLSRAISPYVLRRTKRQVLKELPKKTEQTILCELPPKQRKLYDELKNYYRIKLAEQVNSKGMAKCKIFVLEALLRLRQAAAHPGLIDPKRIGEESAKLESLIEQIREIVSEGHKALVFSQFTSMLAIVKKRLAKEKIRFEYLDGQTNDRKSCVDRFQTDARIPLFLISLKAGGHGLNLTAADYVFLLDPWWNPAAEAQAVDRAHRIGQTKPVFAYRLIAKDTVEEKVVELQKTKRDLAEAVIQANDSLIRKMTAEDLQLLLS